MTGQSQTPSKPSVPSSENVDYYRRFIADYASLSAPLVQYTKQDQHEGTPNLHRDPAAVSAFRTMKKKLMSAPILAYPRFHGKPLHIGHGLQRRPGCDWWRTFPGAGWPGTGDCLRGSATAAPGTKLRVY